MLCCISGLVPTEPVVTRTNGCLYERRLIEKYIAENGRCPMTGDALSKDDLIAVATGQGGSNALRVTPSQATIPGLLQMLHTEWDGLMLEQFSLRQQLGQTQQELSHALFQHDAACRVIAKLIQERDALKKQLGGRQNTAATRPPTDTRNNEETAASDDEEEDDTPAIPMVLCEAIDEHERRLKSLRKHRDPPQTLSTVTTVQSFVEFDSATVHGNQAVTAIDVTDALGNRTCVTGGADGKIIRYDLGRRTVCGTGVGHRKAIRAIKSVGDVVVSASDDTTLRSWKLESGALSSLSCVTSHQAPINDFCLLRTEQHALSVDDAGALVLSDIVKGFGVATAAPSEHTRLGMGCIDLHPDGAVAASGSAGSVLLWDVKMMDVHVKLTPPGRTGGAITSVVFNDDGITLAAGTSNSTVVMWDLRKVQEPLMTLTMNHTPAAKPITINSIAFDHYGKYLAVAMDTVRLWNWREKQELATLSSHIGPVTGVAWGADAKWLATSSLDKTVRFYGAE